MWQSAIGIIIVVILLMVVCYYDFELPIQLSTSERKDLETGRSIIHNQKIILSQIQIIDSLVDHIETSSNPGGIINEANNQNAKLKTILNNDTTQNMFLNKLWVIFDKAIATKKGLIDKGIELNNLKAATNLQIQEIQNKAQQQVIDISKHAQ